ncbi:sigma-70 family RNA polymerase sigma factor [Paenisporosarcina sp. FSL H8-0542]|uniref:sigma-70 family RNA polymerase sigma factor n=1 Tax=Paenisporosarcina sp. FSL H8-0542 TaxID=2921401 RepID=UPI00315AD45B
MKNKVLSDSKEIWVEEIMSAYGDKMIRVGYSYLKDWGMAQEVVQEVFITCYKHYSHYSEAENIKALIYKITINRCKDVLRTNFVRKVIVGSELFASRKSPELSPEEHFVNRDINAILADGILSLPVKYREVILLYYYEDLTIVEIGHMLKTNQNTIKSRLKRGREMLEEKLEGSFRNES